MTAHLELRDVFVRHRARRGLGQNWVQAGSGVSLAVPHGRSLGVLGGAGCGKSSLVRFLLQPRLAAAGTLLYAADPAQRPTALNGGYGQTIGAAYRSIGIVPQDPTAEMCPRMTLDEALSGPLAAVAGLDGAAARARVTETLSRVGLPASAATRLPHELTGSEQRRASIALALVTRPRLLVLDEPVGGLDAAERGAVLDMLARVRRDLGLTLWLLTRSPEAVQRFCDEVAVMHRGRIIEQAPVSALFASPHHPATRRLLDGAPWPASGEGEEPAGCPLHPRCPAATGLCGATRPVLHGRGGHWTACHHAWGGAPPVPAPAPAVSRHREPAC